MNPIDRKRNRKQKLIQLRVPTLNTHIRATKLPGLACVGHSVSSLSLIPSVTFHRTKDREHSAPFARCNALAHTPSPATSPIEEFHVPPFLSADSNVNVNYGADGTCRRPAGAGEAEKQRQRISGKGSVNRGRRRVWERCKGMGVGVFGTGGSGGGRIIPDRLVEGKGDE